MECHLVVFINSIFFIFGCLLISGGVYIITNDDFGAIDTPVLQPTGVRRSSLECRISRKTKKLLCKTQQYLGTQAKAPLGTSRGCSRRYCTTRIYRSYIYTRTWHLTSNHTQTRVATHRAPRAVRASPVPGESVFIYGASGKVSRECPDVHL